MFSRFLKFLLASISFYWLLGHSLASHTKTIKILARRKSSYWNNATFHTKQKNKIIINKQSSKKESWFFKKNIPFFDSLFCTIIDFRTKDPKRLRLNVPASDLEGVVFYVITHIKTFHLLHTGSQASGSVPAEPADCV